MAYKTTALNGIRILKGYPAQILLGGDCRVKEAMKLILGGLEAWSDNMCL